MRLHELGCFAVYLVTQGGAFSKANTIYFYPALSLSQEQDGFSFPNGKSYHWILAVAFLFWTIGVTW